MYRLGLKWLKTALTSQIDYMGFIMNKENFKYDNYLVSYRDSEQDEWTVANIAPMTLEQALAWESLLEREGRKIKIQYNGEQAE